MNQIIGAGAELPPTKRYLITLIDKTTETIAASLCTYDNVGNLIFFIHAKSVVTKENPSGLTADLVKCYNTAQVLSYELAPTTH